MTFTIAEYFCENMNSTVRSRAEKVSNCLVCNSIGSVIYSQVKDRNSKSESSWDIEKCSNKNCNTLWINRRPIPTDLAAIYQGYYTQDPQTIPFVTVLPKKLSQYFCAGYLSAKYDFEKDSVGFLQNFLGQLSSIRINWKARVDSAEMMYLKPQRGCRLLDVGCGNGRLMKHLVKRGWSAVGCDPDIHALELAKQAGLDVLQGNMESINFPDSEFHAITMSHVIEHLYNPKKTLTECARVMRADGIISITTPNSQSLGRWLFGASWFPLDPPRHFFILNRKSAFRILSEVGFREITIFTNTHEAHHYFRRGIMDKLNKPYHPVHTIFGRVCQLIEWAMIILGIEIGEELVILARK